MKKDTKINDLQIYSSSILIYHPLVILVLFADAIFSYRKIISVILHISVWKKTNGELYTYI